MKAPRLLLAGLLIIGVSWVLSAAPPGDKQLKKAPINFSQPDSGAQMFKDYCAVCHGPEGKGNGPAAELLKTPPPDLRTLALRNNGRYPDDRVAATLQFGTSSRAHGTSDMPIWGAAFRSQDPGEHVSKLRIRNLTEFVGSLQQK